MSSETRQCSKCGKKLRIGTSFATCGEHRTQAEKQEAWRRAAEQKRVKAGGKPRVARPDDESDVLSRMGFGGPSDRLAKPAADEAPPATKERKKREPKPPAPAPAADVWRMRFTELAHALGLKPDEMLETHCREWVERTKLKALAADLKQLSAGAEAA